MTLLLLRVEARSISADRWSLSLALLSELRRRSAARDKRLASPENKSEAENAQLQILREAGVECIVMARYMQVLSDRFLTEAGCPVINIHHSFLPAFTGGKPYHQAHQRGVKLIGATAHYATAVLDEGPIIHQDVTRINHRNSVADLIRKGRDLENPSLLKPFDFTSTTAFWSIITKPSSSTKT